MKFLNFLLLADVDASEIGFFEYIWERYFARTLEEYENFSFGEGALPLSVIIGGIILGIIAAFFAMTVYKKTVCAFVEGLLVRDAVGEENAVAFSKLGESERIFKKIENSSALRKTVIVIDKDESGEPLEDPKLYIAEDKKYFAQTHFETKDATWGKLAIICVVCLVGYFLLMELVPALIGMVDSFIGSF